MPRSRSADGPAEPPLDRVLREAVPLAVFGDAQRLAQLDDLLVGQQRRVVHRVARDRQAPALDRVGEHARPARPGSPSACANASISSTMSCPPRSASRPGRSSSGMSSIACATPCGSEAGRISRPRGLLAGAADQALVLLVAHLVDALAQRLAARAARRPPAAGGRTCTPAPASRSPGTATSTGPARMPGMTRSRLWRFRSTIQRTLPSPWM